MGPIFTALSERDHPAAFNNLLLISNWLFRTAPCRRKLALAYLGYSTKLSHLLLPLRAALEEPRVIRFSPRALVIHGESEGGWPKVATWYEMAISVTTFCGFLDPLKRRALKRLLFHSDWMRILFKCLRVGPFYSQQAVGIAPLVIHLHLCLLSWLYALALLLLLPVLLLPQRWLPARVRQQIGHPGLVEGW